MSADRPRPFDAEAFFADLDGVRQSRGLTWKSVAQLSGVSASTLTRMGQGRRPDVDSYAALLAWAGLHGEDYLRGVPRRSTPGTLAEIGVLLRHDPNLSDEAAQAIQALVQASYKQLRENS